MNRSLKRQSPNTIKIRWRVKEKTEHQYNPNSSNCKNIGGRLSENSRDSFVDLESQTDTKNVVFIKGCDVKF